MKTGLAFCMALLLACSALPAFAAEGAQEKAIDRMTRTGTIRVGIEILKEMLKILKDKGITLIIAEHSLDRKSVV